MMDVKSLFLLEPASGCANHDDALAQVPPLPPDAAGKIICQELGLERLSEVFEWIDLEKPLGSASIAQAG